MSPSGRKRAYAELFLDRLPSVIHVEAGQLLLCRLAVMRDVNERMQTSMRAPAESQVVCHQ